MTRARANLISAITALVTGCKSTTEVTEFLFFT